MSQDFALSASVGDTEPDIACRGVLTVNVNITFCAAINMWLMLLAKVPLRYLVRVKVLVMMGPLLGQLLLHCHVCPPSSKVFCPQLMYL